MLADPTTTRTRTATTSSSSLHYSNDETTDGSNSGDSSSSSNTHHSVERIVVSGVSVSTKGFHVLFQTPRKGILPLAVTKDPQDSYKATSPEALTILQLLSEVDMAGAILPPEILAQMAIVQSELAYYNNEEEEEEGNSSTTSASTSTTTTSNNNNNLLLAEYVQQYILPPECTTYKDAHPWFQSRMSLPQITLDQLTIVYDANTGQVQCCQLTCALPKNILWTMEDKKNKKKKLSTPSSSSSFQVNVTPELVEPFAYQYNSETSHIFTSLALALRYKAPIVLQVIGDDEQEEEEEEYYYAPSLLEQDFAQRTSVQNLHQQSTRISQNIEKGFEVNKLMGALQIAKRLGDTAAIQKIQDKLEEYDNMDDLPVIGDDEKSSTTKSTTSQQQQQQQQQQDGMSTAAQRMLREEEDSDLGAFQ